MKKIALLLFTICLFANAQNMNDNTSSETYVSVQSNNLSPADLEARINEINPYTLFRKGSIAEYKFQQDGKDFAYYGGPTYIQMIVADTKIENGQLVAYVQQRYLNKKHTPSKGISQEFLGYLFPTEIDAKGNFHYTHDIAQDMFFIKSRKGYALLMPSTFEVGQSVPSSSIIDEVGGGLGMKYTMKKDYSNFVVEKIEQVITPAGTFECVKITGDLNIDASMYGGNKHYDIWIARGVGVVKLDITPVTKKGKGKMYTMYLNHIELK